MFRGLMFRGIKIISIMVLISGFLLGFLIGIILAFLIDKENRIIEIKMEPEWLFTNKNDEEYQYFKDNEMEE